MSTPPSVASTPVMTTELNEIVPAFEPNSVSTGPPNTKVKGAAEATGVTARTAANASSETGYFFMHPPEYWLISLSTLSALSAMNCPVFEPIMQVKVRRYSPNLQCTPGIATKPIVYLG